MLNPSCSDAPTYALESIEESQLVGFASIPVTSTKQEGYTYSGNAYEGQVSINSNDSVLLTALASNIAVSEVTGNTWLYGVNPVAGGALSFGPQSQLLRSQMNVTTMVSKWLIEVGYVTDQTFGGGSYDSNTVSSLYIGEGDYSTLIPVSAESLNLTSSEVDGTYNIFKLGFGKVVADASGEFFTGFQYFIENTDETYGSPSEVTLALNFQGMGLPWGNWNQVVNYLYKTDQTVAEDLVCTTGLGGGCILAQACLTYTALWEYSFGFFVKVNANYGIIPLSTFAADNTDGTCSLYIQNVNATADYPNRIILGSMFMSQFTAYFETDYTDSSLPVQTLNLTVSTTYANPATYVGQKDIYFSSEGLFDYTPTAVIPITVDSDMNAFVRANLGSQGFADFQLSFNNHYIYSYATTCISPEGSCTDAPYYAQNYFSQEGYKLGTIEDFMIDEKRNYV